MCQRLNTGESNNFYFGIFICIGPLTLLPAMEHANAGVEFHDGNHGKCRDFFSLCRDAL